MSAVDTAPGRRSAVGRALLAALRFYSRAISPAFPPRCRFYPTCSAYAAEAVTRHGAGRGSWLALRRLLRCGPWHPGGVDLVPGAERASGVAGTGDAGHSSCSAKAPAASPPDDRRSAQATPPATRRTTQEEPSLA